MILLFQFIIFYICLCVCVGGGVLCLPVCPCVCICVLGWREECACGGQERKPHSPGVGGPANCVLPTVSASNQIPSSVRVVRYSRR